MNLSFNEVKKMKNGLNEKYNESTFDVKNSVNLKSSYGGTATKILKK